MFFGANIGHGQGVPRFAYVLGGDEVNPDLVTAFTVDPTTGGLTEVEGSPFSTRAYLAWGPTMHPSQKFMYVGHYGNSHIAALKVDAVTGALTHVPGSPFPSWGDLKPAIPPDGRHLYIIHDLGSGHGSEIWGYDLDPETGVLGPVIPGMPIETTSFRRNTLSIDQTGRFLYAYGVGAGNGGARAIHGFKIDQKTGVLADMPGSPFPTPERVREVTMDPLNRFLFVSLGCTFSCQSYSVAVFKIDGNTGALEEVEGSPFATGEFPDALVVEPNGRFGYLNAYNFTEDAHTIYGYDIDESGRLSRIDMDVFRNVEVVSLDPQARFAYAARPVGFPRASYVFQIDQVAHALRQVDVSKSPATPQVFDPTGSFAYATVGPPAVYAFAIDQQSGLFTEVEGSPYPVGGADPGRVILTEGPKP